MEVAVSVVLTIVGLVMLCFGGNWLVNGGVNIAKKFRLSNLVIGMTIVAYGTSTPELAASILLSIDGEISQYDGILLLGGLGVFAFYTYKDIMKHREENKEKIEKEKNNICLKSVGLIGIGITLLYVGAILTVDNAIILAKEFGLSEKIIGLTVIAIGTSLPELITSIIAIRKGHTDIGIGTIVGSNIYNILMIMGIGAALGGVMIGSDVYVDYAIMIIFSLSLLIAIKTGIINRVMGVCLVIGYIAYLIVTFFK